jgi:arylformamidase
MGIRWYDVTIPFHEGMTVWPGDPRFRLSPLNRIAAGAHCNTSLVTFCTHTGTHVDAPWHFEDDGKRLDEIDPALFLGEALLVEIPDAALVRAGDLGQGPLPPRVLIKTANSDIPLDAPFQTHYVALGPDAAQRLVEEGVRLVGVDYLSVAPFKQAGHETHHRLLGNDVLVVEGLRLKGFRGGTYGFVVLPLALAGADGAPCRAFVGREEAAT